MATAAAEALRRYGGMYGAAYRDGFLQQELIEVQGNAAIARIEVPLVGQTKMGYKPGRETREGTMRLQLIDSTWAMEIHQFLSQSLASRQHQLIGPSNVGSLRSFSLILTIDDPDAWDYESWQLDGVQIWHQPIGFTVTDDIINREIPITWEAETPLHVFVVDRSNPVAPIDITPPNDKPIPAGRY